MMRAIADRTDAKESAKWRSRRTLERISSGRRARGGVDEKVHLGDRHDRAEMIYV